MIFGFLWASASSHLRIWLNAFPMRCTLEVLRRQVISFWN